MQYAYAVKINAPPLPWYKYNVAPYWMYDIYIRTCFET